MPEWTPTHDDPRGGRRRRSRSVDKTLRLESREVLVVHEDGVAWLAVLGTGVWGYGHDTGEVVVDRFGVEKPLVVMRSFPAGLHWVDQETVDFAHRARVPYLKIAAEMPGVERRTIDGPLSPEHFKLPADGALVLTAPPAGPVEEMVVVDQGSVPLDFPCSYCPRRCPSAQVLALHVEVEHGPTLQARLEAEPVPDPVEAALTDA